MRRAGVVVVVLGAGLVGCGDEAAWPERPEAVVAERPVEIAHDSIDGRTALDVDLPAGSDCWGGHQPVFSVAFDLPPGPVETGLDVQGAASTRIVEVPASGTLWGVVGVQSQRAWADLQVFADRPEWG